MQIMMPSPNVALLSSPTPMRPKFPTPPEYSDLRSLSGTFCPLSQASNRSPNSPFFLAASTSAESPGKDRATSAERSLPVFRNPDGSTRKSSDMQASKRSAVYLPEMKTSRVLSRLSYQNR